MKKTENEKLAEKWIKLKAKEEEFKRERLLVESKLAELLGTKNNGSKTHEVGDFKITLKTGTNYTIDLESYDNIFNTNKIKQELDITEQKRVLNKKKIESIKKQYPDLYLILSECITSKPAKVGVVIKQQS